MKFRKFADELRNKLLLLGLKEDDLSPFDISFSTNFCYGNLPIITIHYDNEYISSLVLEEIDFFKVMFLKNTTMIYHMLMSS